MTTSRLKLAKISHIIAPHIAQLDIEKNRQAYRDYKFNNADKVKDLNRRYRFDVLYAIPKAARQEFFDLAYGMGANDNHVESLLKALIKDL